ncbi:MAG: Guanylate kinase, partial [Gammaproteobacteria bacterium]|nr:Guanylate kinase [Gammaproteobacteria bacterium]
AEDLGHWTEFDYVVINDDFARAIEDLQSIVGSRGGALVAQRPEVVHLAAALAKPQA